MTQELISINGIMSQPAEAKISVYDRGFLYGDAIYEVTRSYGRVLFFLEAHIDRLFRSAESIGVMLPFSKEECIVSLYDIHRHANGENAYLRIQVTRGEGPIQIDPKSFQKPNVIVYVKPLPIIPEVNYTAGIRIATTHVLRNTKRAMDPNIKSGNYLNNILAILSHTPADAAEWILCNSDGNLTEGTTSNIFMVASNVVRTPGDDHDILFGITRAKVLSLCRDLNIEVDVSPISSSELMRADEVFITSSTREVMPVSHVNGHEIRQAPGPVTLRLLSAYREEIVRYCAKSAESRIFAR